MATPQGLKIINAEIAHVLYGRILFRIKGGAPTTQQKMADEVRFFRLVLEEMYKHLCEKHNRWFADLHARMVFTDNMHGLPYDFKEELHGLRRLANEVAHKMHYLSAAKYQSATKVLAEGIQYFSSVAVPEDIEIIYRGRAVETLIVPPNWKYETMGFDRCVVTAISEPKEEYPDWLLTCHSECDKGQYQLRLKNNSYENKYNYEFDFSQIGSQILPYTKLHLYNISKDNNTEGRYRTFRESLIVLEPDLLVDVSTVAKCYLDMPQIGSHPQELNLNPSPRWGLMQKLQSVDTNQYLLLGNLANSMLDTWLTEPKPVWPEAIDKAVKSAPWDSLRVGGDQLKKTKQDLIDRHICNFEALPPKQKGDHDVIEPTFYSVRYGLFGRLDFFRESGQNPLKKDIYELKSGKTEAIGTKSEHQMQTIGYHLLLRSAYQNNAVTTAAVLYSQAERNPVRNVTTSHRLEQHFSMTRSLYVGELLRLSEGKSSLFQHDPKMAQLHLPKFTAKDIAAFEARYAAATTLEQEYVKEYCAFLTRELIHQKVGSNDRGEASQSMGFSALWRLDMDEKKEVFAIIADLSYKSSETSERNRVTFARPQEDTASIAFRQGDLVLLYPQLENGRGALRHQVLKGTLEDLTQTHITLRLLNPQADHGIFGQHKLWCLEKDMMESSTFNMMQSTVGLLKHSPEKRALFLGQKAPRFAGTNPIDLTQITKDYKESQSKAIQTALAAQDFMLIQGPPGTGKTSRVLAEIVLQIFKNSQEVIFLLAYTNRAVDKLLESIKDLGKRDAQHKIPLLRLTSSAADEDGLSFKARNLNLEETEKMVAGTRVFVATISSFLRQQGSLPMSIPRNTLIIDEASQVLEPHVAGIIPSFDRFMLIGDHKQLPPIVTQPERGCISQSRTLEQAGMQDLRMSIFERLWRQAESQARQDGVDAAAWGKCTMMLEEHFRMHEDIARHVGPHYQGRLRLGKPAKQQQALPLALTKDPLSLRLSTRRVLFMESPTGDTRINSVEAMRVRQLVQAIYSLRSKDDKSENYLGIITPWRAQINCINRVLAQAKQATIPVDTVERFQGSECANIILSLATSTQPLLEVLTSSIYVDGNQQIDRKLNVSLSRAEERLIILGESAVLNQNAHYQGLIQAIKAQGGYVSLTEARQLFSEI